MVRRILNMLHMPQISDNRRQSDVYVKGRRRTYVRLVPDFHSDLAFWRLIIDGAMVSGPGTIAAPLHSFYLQPPFRSLFSDASGIAIGGYCRETGVWWRFDLDDDQHHRLSNSPNVVARDKLSINLLELLGMAINAATFLAAGHRPRFSRDTLLLRGDNSAAVTWINKCRGGKEPRSGALMRVLGCLEMGSDWCFEARHVSGIDNEVADGISRWQPRSNIPYNLKRMYPDIEWREQVLSPSELEICSGVLDSSTSEDQLRNRLDGLMELPSVLGAFFANRLAQKSM